MYSMLGSQPRRESASTSGIVASAFAISASASATISSTIASTLSPSLPPSALLAGAPLASPSASSAPSALAAARAASASGVYTASAAAAVSPSPSAASRRAFSSSQRLVWIVVCTQWEMKRPRFSIGSTCSRLCSGAAATACSISSTPSHQRLCMRSRSSISAGTSSMRCERYMVLRMRAPKWAYGAEGNSTS